MAGAPMALGDLQQPSTCTEMGPGEGDREGLSPLTPVRALPCTPRTLDACSGPQLSGWDPFPQTLVPRIGSRAAEPFSDPVRWENQGRQALLSQNPALHPAALTGPRSSPDCSGSICH